MEIFTYKGIFENEMTENWDFWIIIQSPSTASSNYNGLFHSVIVFSLTKNDLWWCRGHQVKSKMHIPYILKAYSTLTFLGALSLKTDIMSRKSSNVISPSPLDEKTLVMRSLNGFTYKLKHNILSLVVPNILY